MELRRFIIACVLCSSIVGCSQPPMAESTASVSEAPPRTPDGFFDSNGARIHYTDTGDGEAVVLIHGFTSNLSRWVESGITGRLADRGFRVIAIDAQGHGQSDKPSEANRYGDAMVEAVARLMDHLAIERIHLVGYSMGGLITNKFREAYPERLRTAILG